MLYIGSARHDENGKYAGGAAGDQLQGKNTSYVGSDDHTGEISFQEFYVHSKGWKVLRAKDIEVADKIADAMAVACNNKYIGYDQYQRTGVITTGIDTTIKTECDCSSLVRACVIRATGKDPGNFNTENEVKILSKTGLFLETFDYTAKTPLFNGDILCTKTKGHTVVVVSGSPRQTNISYYPACDKKETSFVDALGRAGEKNTSMANRRRIAAENGVAAYSGTEAQNIQLLGLLKAGRLKKA